MYEYFCSRSINDCACAPFVRVADRIVNGETAKENSVPYHVAVVRKNGAMCGGTILNKKYILTAAHCIANFNTPVSPNKIRIFVGLTNKCKHHLWERGLSVEKVISNPAYDSAKITSDIALLKLRDSLKFTQKIKPACLPTDLKNMYVNKKAVVTGWGLNHLKFIPCKLQVTRLKVMGNMCYGSNSRICAHAPTQKSVCFGDSGGPMTVNDNGNHVIVGVTSGNLNI